MINELVATPWLYFLNIWLPVMVLWTGWVLVDCIRFRKAISSEGYLENGWFPSLAILDEPVTRDSATVGTVALSLLLMAIPVFGQLICVAYVIVLTLILFFDKTKSLPCLSILRKRLVD